MTDKLITGATFFDRKYFLGEAHHYPENDIIIPLPYDLNDRFRSVRIGTLSKVYAWRHQTDCEPGQRYREWEYDHPDIDREIRGLSKFKVAPKNTCLVALRLIDDTYSGIKFSMFTNTHCVGPVETTTDDDYALVGILPFETELVTAIAIRNTSTGVYINNGSFYFYRDANGVVSIDEKANFPKNLRIVNVGGNRFDIHIISTEFSN
ncbi:beta/gamma crystallin domain-containing protein [Photorhabdus luminescens]|uniref:beta/gamma crystallin domain-containing protein n=1 Tax=Photorhabdus luminescens TaxID=29488 RepID=UPI00223F5EBB|nr:beta/gamma crystallin domain-containing protein [Photorhabdus luminescens]MCW7764134.1 beta/gamma crystallin domain-containing protein [Photorhabdus luminescens subsp. venezuelensis]